MIQSQGLNSATEDHSATNNPSSRLLPFKETHSKLPNERLLAILYTSGSTGIPKGARILHSGAINRLRWQWNEFPYKEGDVCAFKVIQKE